MSARSNEHRVVRTNAGVVQETYEAVGRGDIPALLDLLTDDVEWTFQGPSSIPFAGTRRGREGVAEFFPLVGENLGFQEFEPREFVAQGDAVFMRGSTSWRNKRTGQAVDTPKVDFWRFRDGKAVEFYEYFDTARVIAAAGG